MKSKILLKLIFLLHFFFTGSISSKIKSKLINFKIDTNNILVGSKNLSLLNSSNYFDSAYFIQSLNDFYFNFENNFENSDKLLFSTIFRSNIVFGADNESFKLSSERIKIGRAVTETKHTHSLDTAVFGIKESYLEFYHKASASIFKLGCFSQKIGLGLILGDAYKVRNILDTNFTELYIDQFRPGFLFSKDFFNSRYSLNLYYGINSTNSTSFENQVLFVNSQELCDNSAPYKRKPPSRESFSNNYLILCSVSFKAIEDFNAKKFLTLKPFILYNSDNNQSIEFKNDAKSKLVTFGSSVNFLNNKLSVECDFALNCGAQFVKAFDRNVAEEHARLTYTHLFAQSNQYLGLPNIGPANGTWVLSPVSTYPPEEDASLNYSAGEKWTENNTNLISSGPPPIQNINYIFKNSYSRFRRAYKNFYSGFMIALDLNYKFDSNLDFGCITGFSTGDANPNDSYEKALLFRLHPSETAGILPQVNSKNSEWANVRSDLKDHIYTGFVGLDSLYSGKAVKSMYLLKVNKLERTITQQQSLTANNFSNLAYLGFGSKYENSFKNFNFKWNPNIIFFSKTSSVPFGYDATVQDVYETFAITNLADGANDTVNRFKNANKELPNFLGIELNNFFDIYALNDLKIYSILSIFVPGSYYDSIKALSYKEQGQVMPIKNQLDAIKADMSGVENVARNSIALLNNCAFSFYLGFKYDFDLLFDNVKLNKKFLDINKVVKNKKINNKKGF